MTTQKALLAVLAGFTSGVVLGLLFAPAKGSDTRINIVRKGGDIKKDALDALESKFNELVSKLETVKKAMKREAAIDTAGPS